MIRSVKKVAIVSSAYCLIAVFLLDNSLIETILTGIAIGIAITITDKLMNTSKVDREVEQMKKLARGGSRDQSDKSD
jgi:hypothetical protein